MQVGLRLARPLLAQQLVVHLHLAEADAVVVALGLVVLGVGQVDDDEVVRVVSGQREAVVVHQGGVGAGAVADQQLVALWDGAVGFACEVSAALGERAAHVDVCGESGVHHIHQRGQRGHVPPLPLRRLHGHRARARPQHGQSPHVVGLGRLRLQLGRHLRPAGVGGLPAVAGHLLQVRPPVLLGQRRRVEQRERDEGREGAQVRRELGRVAAPMNRQPRREHVQRRYLVHLPTHHPVPPDVVSRQQDAVGDGEHRAVGGQRAGGGEATAAWSVDEADGGRVDLAGLQVGEEGRDGGVRIHGGGGLRDDGHVRLGGGGGGGGGGGRDGVVLIGDGEIFVVVVFECGVVCLGQSGGEEGEEEEEQQEVGGEADAHAGDRGRERRVQEGLSQARLCGGECVQGRAGAEEEWR